MGSLLMERLAAARRQRFVGRSRERALFQSALEAGKLPFVALYLFGAGGVGKTTLLREFTHLSAQLQTPCFYIDSRNIEPSPDAFLTVLHQSLGLDGQVAPASWLAAQPTRMVLLLDTMELLTPIEAWLREHFLPGLPGNVLVVMAGRTPPSAAWRADPGWAAMMKVVPLRNLSAEESREYLVRCQVPQAEHSVVWDFTRGHPLALSLVVDAFAQRPGGHFQPEEAPDMIKTLLDQFVQKAPSPAHRAALEACALVRMTNEALLSALLQTGDVHELFEWLRSLSFIEMDRRGLFPHDLAREVLVADVRWRNPEWYAELHGRARAYYVSRVQQGDAEEQGRVLSDYVYLHRDNPVVRPYFEWQASSMVFADALRPGDVEALVAMVGRHEGEEAAAWAAEWLERQPKAVSVVRFASGEPQGMVVALPLEKIAPELRERDPAVRPVWQFLAQHAPLRPGETTTLFRFWLAHDTYQDVSPVQSCIFFTMVQHYLTTPRLAYTFLPCANPNFWRAVFTYADLARIEAADYLVGGRRYGVYGHDWRIVTPMAWLALLAERELDAEIRPETASPSEAVAIMNQEQFAEAVRDALRDFTNPNALRNNPLLQTRLILRRCGPDKSSAQRIALLQGLLAETTALLQKSPKQIKLYRALHHTYFEPAPTQEQAAELLALPFSTYRRHLRAGLDAVAEQLWQQEMG